METLIRVNEHKLVLENEHGLEIAFTSLQGSQNYGLDYNGSDVDTRSVIMPTFKNIIYNNKLSHEYVVGDEHADTSGLMGFCKLLAKGNINILETISSNYTIVNEKYSYVYDELLSNRHMIESLFLKNSISSVIGQLNGVIKYLDKKIIKDEFLNEKFVVKSNRKKMVNLIRFTNFLYEFNNSDEKSIYKLIYIKDQTLRNYLIDFKKNEEIEKDDFVELFLGKRDESETIIESVRLNMVNYQSQYDEREFDELVTNLYKRHVKELLG